MTVRELIQTLILESPNLDAQVYVQKVDEKNEECFDFIIDKVTDGGTNDALFIEIKDWKENE